MKKLLFLTFFMLSNLCAAIAEGILPDVITVKVGETVDLWSFVTLPNNLDPVGTNYQMDWQWDDPNGYFQIVQGSYWAEVTGLKATPSNALLSQNISVSAWNVFGYPSYMGSSVIKVVAPDVQQITVVTPEITVGVGETAKLAELLSNAIQLSPNGADASHIQWSVADETIVGKYYQNTGITYTPLKVGTTTMTPKAVKDDVLNPPYLTSSQSVTVHVVQPVTGITISPNLNQYKCNVGDDLTAYLNGLVKVSPDNATDKSVKWMLLPTDFTDPNNPPIQIGSDGKITAVKEGSAKLEVSSVSNPSVYAKIVVEVHNIMTDFSIAKSTLNYVYDGSSIAIGQDLSNNLTMLPVDFVEGGELEVTSSNPAVVNITNCFMESVPQITANVVGVGDAVITVKLTYIDYLASNNKSGTAVKKSVTKTFNVHVDAAVRLSFVGNDIPCIIGDDLTQFLEGRLRYEPTNLADKSHTWKVVSGDAVSITNGTTVKAVKAGKTVIRATLTAHPDKTVDVTIDVGNPATDIVIDKDVIGVVYSGSGQLDISQQLKANVHLLPQDFDDYYYFGMSSSNTQVLQTGSIEPKTHDYDPRGYYVVGAGETTVTVTLTYTDRLKLFDDYPENQVRKTVTKTFKVRVLQQPTAVVSNSQHESENCNVGDDLTAYLNSIIEVQPANAYDKTIRWEEVGNTGILQITDNGTKIKAVKPGYTTIYAVSVANPNARKAEVHIRVHQQANDIALANQTLTVEYFDQPVDISKLLKDNITILPADFTWTNGFSVTSSNAEIVNVDVNVDVNNLSAQAKAVGSATITVSLQYVDYLKLYTDQTYKAQTISKTFTVNVVAGVIPVSSVTNNSPRNVEECNVGDDLTAHLNSLITVAPGNATDKTYAWSVAQGDAVSVSNGVITAVKAGTAVLKATSVSTPNVAATVTVQVHNPATDVQFANATLNVGYKGEAIDVSKELKDNISVLPAGYESIGHLAVTSSRSDVVNVDVDVDVNSLKATVQGEGEATITVSFDYVDYLAKYAGKSEGEYTKSVSKSFSVVVITTEIPVKSITFDSQLTQHDCNVGDDLTTYLNNNVRVAPENATDKSYTWSVTEGDAVTVDNSGNITAVKVGTATLAVTSTNNPEAKATVQVVVHNPARDIKIEESTLTVDHWDDPVDISDQILRNITLQPEDYDQIESLTVTSSEPEVINVDVDVDVNKFTLSAEALAGGEATITVELDYTDYYGQLTDPSGLNTKTVTKSFTVLVVQQVTAVTNNSPREAEECNVGDDLTAHLNGLITVAPEDATDKSYTWSVAEGDAVTVDYSGNITAVTAGTAILKATSVSSPDVAAEVSIIVHNQANDINLDKESLTVEYIDQPVDISQLLRDNISVWPDDFTMLNGFEVTSSDADVVDVDVDVDVNNLSAQAKAVGSATITVSLQYVDFLKQYADQSYQPTTISKTFTVNVVAGVIPVSSITNDSPREAEECNVGDDLTAHLNGLIIVAPEDATDKTYTWSVAEGDAVKVSNGVITAVKAGTAVLKATSVSTPDVSAEVSIIVHNPATDVQFTSATLNVAYKGETVDVSKQLQDNITVLPAGYESIGNLAVTSSRTNVVNVDVDVDVNTLTATVLGEGEATITVSFDYIDYLAKYAGKSESEYTKTVSKSFKVVVVTTEIPVKGITISSELTQHDCNVGDDLTTYLNNMVKVSPENATDKTYTWSVTQGDAVKVSNGKITAVKAGTATLTVASASNPEVKTSVTIQVHNPATDVQFASATLNVAYKGEAVDVSKQMQDNITVLPAGYESIGHLAVTSSRTDIVNVDVDVDVNTLTATVLGEGEATITVSFDYIDYLAKYAGKSESEYTKTVSKSFKVVVVTTEIPVKGITINSELTQHDCNVGDDLTTYLNNMVKVSPENATDKTYTWSVTQGDAVKVSNGKITAVKAGTATLTVASASNPEVKASVTVLVHNPATDVQFASATLNVAYKGEAVDVSKQLQDNITVLPAGYESIGHLAVTSSRTDIVNVDVDVDVNTLTATVQGEGEATITVSFDYIDYLAKYAGKSEGEYTKTVSKSFKVVVVTTEIPVTGISLNQTRVGCTIGDDITSFLNSLVLIAPANATDKSYTWSVTQGDAVVIDSDGKMTGVKHGESVLTVTSTNNPEAKATITVLVHNNARDIAIVEDVITVDFEGEPVDIGDLLKNNIIVLPTDFRDIDAYSVTSSNPEVVNVDVDVNVNSIKAQALSPGTAVITVTLNVINFLEVFSKTGSGHYTVTKQFTVEVKQVELPQVDLTFEFPDEITLSKFRTTYLTLSNLNVDAQYFDIGKVSVVPYASTTATNADISFTQSDTKELAVGLVGQLVGNYQFRVFYEDRPMKSVSGKEFGIAHIEAEIPLSETEWEWISIPYLPVGADNISLWKNSTEAADFMGQGDHVKVLEVQSQEGLLYNDPSLGLFGDISSFDPKGGMYKVRANGTQEGNTINLGTDVRTLASFNNEVPIVEGYNWINNPNEFELTLDDLNMLALHGQDGDVIIGQTSSVAYNIAGKRWVGPADFRLQPCKGYIFFTMSDNHQNINLLFSGRPSSLLTSMINSEARQHTSRLPWTLKNRGYADNMPMMVRIEGLDQPENYVIGAFVNEECRGVGEVVTRDVMLLNVAGKYGDKVTLRLYNRLTGEELAVNQQMNYTSMLGSLSSPLRLTASVDLGVNHNLNANFSVDKDAVIYSVSGQRLSAPGRGINIIRTTEGSRRILKTIKK